MSDSGPANCPKEDAIVNLQALLPLVTYPDPVSPHVGSNAAIAASQLEVELHALAVNVDIPPVSNALSRFLLNTPEMIREANARSRKNGEDILQIVADQAKLAGVRLVTDRARTSPVLLGDLAAGRARYFDLALIGWEAANETTHTLAEDVIFGSGRPAILLPELVKPAAFDHVAIGWDGSRVAARAVADATLLLRRASKISVLTVTDEKTLPEEEPGVRLAKGLRERGLPAESYSIAGGGSDIAVTLQENALQRGAGLLVMGGYGHTRVRDFILGGATDGILRDLRLPVLVSH
jgi:nucleotide-binding universal stress UspA family protein